jgi:hypothetical protein
MEREKKYIIAASGSCRRDRLPRSDAPTPCFISCAGSALRELYTLQAPTTYILCPRFLDL